MQNQQIAYSKLRLSPANVRKHGVVTGLDALAASIAEHGLLQPLIVSPAKGKKTLFDVHAGGRRWRAIGLLIEQGKIAKDEPVDVRVCNDEQEAAHEISLAENLIREAMTPADECNAYRSIVEGGAMPEDVARRFGVTVRHVQGRLRLADLAEPIFEALAEGSITLDVAKAYASSPDREMQMAAWNALSSGWQGDNPQTIRRHLAASSLDAQSPVALFVGETDYVAAGGRIERDLFAREGDGLWLDRDIADNIALARLTAEAESAAVGHALAWVRPILATNIPYDATEGLRDYWPPRAPLSEEAEARGHEIGERLQAIEEEIEEAEEAEDAAAVEKLEAENAELEAEYDKLNDRGTVIPKEDQPHVGTFMLINSQGQAVLASRYYSTAPAKRGKSATTGGSTDPGAISDALPRSLEEQLAKDRRDVLALHIAQDPALALDLAIFSLSRKLAGHYGYIETGCTVTISDRFEPAGLNGAPPTPAINELDAVRSGLRSEWADTSDAFEAFAAFRALDDADKAAWLAFAVANSLKASLQAGPHANSFQTALGALMEIDTAQHWRPSAEGFFDRIRKPQILSVLGKLDAELPGRYASAKKSELSETAARLCAGDTIAAPEVKERALTWVPDVMQFGAAETQDEDGPASGNDAEPAELDHEPVEVESDNDDADEKVTEAA